MPGALGLTRRARARPTRPDAFDDSRTGLSAASLPSNTNRARPPKSRPINQSRLTNEVATYQPNESLSWS